MRRILCLALLAISLMPVPRTARAQATADQLNKLSLEALTARTPGGGGGGYARQAARPTYQRPYRRYGYVRPRYYYGRRYAAGHLHARPAPFYRRPVARRGYGYDRPAPHWRRYRAPVYHRSYRR